MSLTVWHQTVRKARKPASLRAFLLFASGNTMHQKAPAGSTGKELFSMVLLISSSDRQVRLQVHSSPSHRRRLLLLHRLLVQVKVLFGDGPVGFAQVALHLVEIFVQHRRLETGQAHAFDAPPGLAHFLHRLLVVG